MPSLSRPADKTVQRRSGSETAGSAVPVRSDWHTLFESIHHCRNGTAVTEEEWSMRALKV
jgi:hypothetical protein